MNDSEKRRKQLLAETRARYRDYGSTPAVHPRYRAAYNRLYEYEKDTENYSTFGIRAMICCLLFGAFVAMDYQGREVMDVGSDRIIQEITTDLDVVEVWKEL